MEIKNDKNSIKLYVVNARLPKSEYRVYYENQLINFAQHFDPKKIRYIDFGKQDIRGSHSITIHYPNSCCSGLKYFGSMKELISFIEGFNNAKDNLEFKQYLKVV